MAPRGAPLFSSGVVFCAFLRLVVCQLEAMDARDHFRMDHDKHDHTDVSSSSKSSDPDFTAAPLATTSGTTTSNGTPRSTALPLGFGSDCSHDGQCNALLGLACISIANNASKCGCASSTPIYVNEGGVHKCVRAKNLNEACVSNQECNYGNPNVQCVNNFCNCSHPFELTATRLCLLPSNQGGNMFTMALSVMLVLALLLLAAGYVYQKMVRERDSSSSSGITSSSRRSRRKRKRSSDATTTTSTTCILAKDRSSSDGANEPEYSAGDNDSCEAQEEDLRRQPRGPHAGSYMRDSSMPPRHPPRFIRQQAAKGHKSPRLSTVQEADSSSSGGEEPQEELYLSSSSAGDQPKEDLRAAQWRRTRKGQRLPSLDGRKTGGELIYNKPGSSSPPMHMLGPKDEQMQRVFDKQQVVVTIETHKPRPLGTSPSPPPVVSLLRRELPPSESTDDSFMKDLKRRRSLKARFSDDFCGTMSRRCSVSAEPLRVAAVAVQCDAAQDTPAEAAPVATVAKEAPKVAEPQATGATFGTSVPVHGFTASTKPVKKQTGDIEHGEQAPPKAIEEVAIDKTLQLDREYGVVKVQPHLQSIDKNDRYCTIPDKISLNAGSINAKRRSSSPPVLRSSVTEDRTEQDKTLPVVQAEEAESSATWQSRVPVAVSTACVKMGENGMQWQVQPADENAAAVKVLDIVKPHADNSVDKRPGLTVLKDSNTVVGSAEIAGPKTPSQNAGLEDLLVDAGVAGKTQQKQTDYLGIEAVGELACLLSRLIKTHEKVGPTSSVEDSAITTVQRSVKRKQSKAKRSAGTAHSTSKTDSVITGHTEESSAGTSKQFSDRMAGGVGQKSVTREHALRVQPDVSMEELSQEQTAAKQRARSVEEFARKTAEPETPELSEAEFGKKLDIKKQKTPAEADQSPLNQTAESTIRKMKLQEATIPAEQSSLKSTTRESSSADDAKYGSDRIGGRTPEPILVGVQDYRGWVDIGAAYAAQRPPKDGASLGLSEMVGNTSGPRDISLTFSDVGGIRSVRRKASSASSVPSDTTPSLSGQRPYQEYIAKQLQPPVHFAERPFAEVLASMESEMPSVFKDDHTTGAQGTERDLDKSSPTSAPQSSSQSAMNDENLDKAVIESSSKGASGTGSGVISTSGDGAESPNSVVSTTVTPDGKIASKAAKTATSVDSNSSSKEMPRARLTMSDSDDGSFPPSGSMSLSFVSSNSSCNAAHRLTDLADLPTLEHSVAASSHETGDGSLVLRMPLPRLTSSSAVQTESSRPPASSLTECGTQAQLLPETGPAGRSGWPQLRKTRRREVVPRAATDRPWTEDVKRVVMLGNKHYLRQHAGRRPMAKSATTLDETRCVLFKIDDRSHPGTTASLVSPEALLSMPPQLSSSSELTRESSESTLEILIRGSTVSSGRDADMLTSDDNSYEQPLKLSDLILLQHPEVGLRNFTAVDFSKAADTEGVAQRQSITLEALIKDKLASDLNRSHQCGASQPISEKACLKPAAAKISRELFSASNEAAALTENGGKCLEAIRKPHRQSLVKPSVKAADHERRLDQEGAVSRSEARVYCEAEQASSPWTTAPTVHFAASLPSQHVLFRPDCSVAIRLPGGVIRSVHPGQQAFGTASPQGRAAIRADQKSRLLLMHTTLVEPSFESIYNSILQSPPRVTTGPEPSGPGDVARPGRATSSTRTVSFDDSLTTVVPLEPPPEAFKCDTADTTVSSEPEAPFQWRKARRRSSLCRSLTGSRLQTLPAAPGVENTEVARGATREMRHGGPSRLAPVLVRPGAVATKASGVADVGVDRPGFGSGRQESPTPLMSPFYSFEDTHSELSFMPDSNNFDRSGSTASSQRSDDHKKTDEASAPRPA